jgi:hypothetical protein
MHTKLQPENLKRCDHLTDIRDRWEDNIRLDLNEIGCEGVD